MPVSLDAGAQPLLQPEEISYRLAEGIAVHDRDVKRDDMRDGLLMITSHRICWIDRARRKPVGWLLSHIVDITSEEGTLMFGHSKIVVHLSLPPTAEQLRAASVGPAYPTLPGSLNGSHGHHYSTHRLSGGRAHIKLSFHKGGRDASLEDLRKAMQRKAWEAAAGPAQSAETAITATDVMRAPGIGGLLERRAKAQAESSQLTNTAFGDLEELAKHARSLVAMAEQYASEAQRKAAAAAAGSSTGSGDGSPNVSAPDADVASAGSLALSMGLLSNPITKASSGGLFYSELARQIAAFIGPYLARVGGLAPLTDIYCLYNRARRTDLVSPEDVLEAARLMGTSAVPGLGMRLVRLQNGAAVPGHSSHSDASNGGLLVLQLDSFSPEAAAQRIEALLRKRVVLAGTGAFLRDLTCEQASGDPYVTAIELNALWRVPLPVAQQLLAAAEQQGRVCRDASLSGLRFYLNRFVEA